jgi:ATP-dependent Clp protease protease subunit
MSNKRYERSEPEMGCETEEDKSMALLENKLLKHRTILVSDQVNRDLVEKVVAKILLLEAEDPKKMITVYVNSPGGDADSGFAIYDAMKFVSCPVRTVCAGLCASAGVVIFLGGDKGERFSFPNARFLLHQPSTGTQGQASDIEITAKEIVKMRDRYNQIVSKETGITVKQIAKDANRDFWLSAEEAEKYGLLDRIIATRSEIM